MLSPVTREALVRYPDTRVILTLRDNPEKWAASVANIQKNLLIDLNHGPMGIFFRLTGQQVPGWMASCAQHALLLGASYAEVSRECHEAGLPSSRWIHAMFERDADS